MAVNLEALATVTNSAQFSLVRPGGPLGRVFVTTASGGTGFVVWSGSGAGDQDTWQWTISLDPNYSYLMESMVVLISQSSEAALAATTEPWIELAAMRGMPRGFEWRTQLRRINGGAISLDSNAGTEVGASLASLTSVADTFTGWSLDVTARPPAPIETDLPGTVAAVTPTIRVNQGCRATAPGGTWGAIINASFLQFDRLTAESI